MKTASPPSSPSSLLQVALHNTSRHEPALKQYEITLEDFT